MVDQDKKQRIRNKIKQKSTRPRIVVNKSNKHITAQIIDSNTGETVASASDKQIKGKTKGSKKKSKGVVIAEKVGKLLAKNAKKSKIKKVVFDRSGYPYKGKVKALAEGARDEGLKF